MITDEQIKNMNTVHAGGYTDIVKFLEGLKGAKFLNNYRTKAVEVNVTTEIKNAREASLCTGIFATRIQHVLAYLGYPTVNSPDWPSACAFWPQPKS